jgi:hypothetical protein
MNIRNNRTRRYFLLPLLLLVGIPLFVMPTFAINYNIYVPVVAVVIIYGSIISYNFVTIYKYNM